MGVSRHFRSSFPAAIRFIPIIVPLVPAAAFAQHFDEEVIVVATPRDSSVGDLAQSVTIVGGATLDRVRAASLGETLEGQLGMSASSFGAGASRPVVRGLAGARVKTLIDGIDAMDVAAVSVDHAVGIDPLVARQIEIFRGPTTLLYGGGAVGGVVNTVTTRIPQSAPAQGLEASVEIRADTVARDRSAAMLLDGGSDRFAWHFDATGRDAGDYSIPGFADVNQDPATAPEGSAGSLVNSALRSSAYALGASWLGGNAFFGIAASGFDSVYGVPMEPAQVVPGVPTTQEEPVRIDLSQRRVDMRGEIDFADVRGLEGLKFSVGVNDYGHVELEGSSVGTRFENNAYEARFELLHAPIGEWTGAAGLQFGDRSFQAIGDEAFVPPVATQSVGVFLLEERDFSAWTVSLGGRAEIERQTPTGGSPSLRGTARSVSAAAVREFAAGYSLTVNLASAERLPSAEELYSFGPHLATGTFELGNAALGAETSRHVDLSMRREAGERALTVTAFVTDFSDYIYLGDTGTVDAVDALPVFAFAQAGARFVGFEAEFFTPLARWRDGEFDLRLFGDRVAAELANGEPLPRIPPLRIGARLEYHRQEASVGAEITGYAAQERLAPFETRTAGFTMVNVDMSREFSRGDSAMTFFLRATNLLDEEARRHTSMVKDIAPLPGRNLAVGFRSEF